MVTVSKPGVYLWRMIVFLTLIGFLSAILYSQIKTAFMTNPALNGMILAVLFIGTLYSFGQILRLYPEIRWINNFRFADPGNTKGSKAPTMLASMANMFRNQSGPFTLSTNVTSAILDSVGSRLDEARDTSRYLVGLLIFLGLLGTFWGLLGTIQSVGETISSLDTSGSGGVAVFEALKQGLQAPLQGMGTAFSSSLFGLAGSLILGFLDLQSGQSQNRFYHETEEWLAGMTTVETENGKATTDKVANNTELAHMLTAVAERLDRNTGGMVSQNGINVADSLEQLISQMRAEQKIVRQWMDEQANQNAEMRHLMAEILKNRGR